ncbi:hypothetical protein AX16_008654 [Volvariella volvacea WC 439]|nr:hypothetical protein AX16_008654 [Volvariella volvacea WC 439]
MSSTSFTPTQAELALVNSIFAQADSQKLGILTGDVAVKIFNGANLPPIVLGEIWSIADEGDQGWLSKKGVAMALRLIAWAQRGEKISPALLSKAGPLPTIDGYPSIVQHNTGVSSPASPTPGNNLPPLTSQDRTKFMNMFLKAGPTDGYLDAQKAREIFLKSKLPNDTLIQIWSLADTRNSGTLDATEFAIGMYFIQAVMTNQISTLPAALPPGLYQQAAGTSNQSAVRTHITGNSGSFGSGNSNFTPARSPLQSQYTGQSLIQPDHTGQSNRAPHLPARPAHSTLVNRVVSTPPHPSSHSATWDVSSEEKHKFDGYFNTLDAKRQGYIEGDVAVPFMLNSKLPEADLARIWDLSDLSNNGRLTRDTFAVAMHLIHQRLAGHPLPAVIPPTLIPPALRDTSSPTRTSFVQQEPVKDLFSWDDTPPTSAVAEPNKSASPYHASPPQVVQEPFSSSPFSSTAVHKDLLGDDDDALQSPAIQDHSAEIGNLHNQLNSTNRSLETVKQERVSTEKSVEIQVTQLSALQTQLSAAKAAYDTETKLLATLRERYATQAQEIKGRNEELIRAESDLSAIRVEKAELEGSFLRDKEEARELHRKMLEAGKEAEALKAEVEKLKKDAKQQKGLLAIARKQLSTKEAERAKVEKELKEAQAELEAITKEQKDVETELAALDGDSHSTTSVTLAASVPLPGSPEPSTVVTSPSKSNNPFERLASTGTGHTSPRSQSPFNAFAPPVSQSSISDPVGPTDAFSLSASHPDPFGFEQVSEVMTPERILSPQATGTNLENGSARPPGALTPTTGDESEVYTTPPATAPTRSNATSPTPAATTHILLESPQSQPAEAPSSAVHDSAPEQRRSLNVTDLGTKLEELEVDESESDSDDEIPLAELAKQQNDDNVKPQEAPVPPSIAAPKVEANAQPPTSTFDDIFGVLDSPPTLPSSKLADAFTTTSGDKANGVDVPSSLQTSGPPLTGLNAFDAALGKLSSTPPTGQTPAKQISFDADFEDNFDFAAATSNFPPITEIEAPANGQPSESQKPNTSSGFDDLFGALSSSDNKIAAQTTPESTGAPTLTASGPETSKLTENTTRISADHPGTLSTSTSQSAAYSPTPDLVTEPTSPPKSFSSRSDNGPTSPLAREKSPPAVIRTSSPKPARPSTSSSTHERLKEPPSRTSKLSIRLPFGKKKKTQPEPLPSTHLTPPQEHPRTISPALDDDVEPVKQLVNMGFTRSEAVAALERNAYDLPKAINSLLGTQ